MKRSLLFLISSVGLLPLPTMAASDALSTGLTLTIDQESFGVFYENPTFTDKGLILFIDNDKCVAKYRVVHNEVVVGSGQINTRAREKIIPFGTTTLRIECGSLNALTITRQ